MGGEGEFAVGGRGGGRGQMYAMFKGGCQIYAMFKGEVRFMQCSRGEVRFMQCSMKENMICAKTEHPDLCNYEI